MSKEIKLVPIHVPKVLYENRYCNQDGFSILICGGKDSDGKVTNEVLELEKPSFKVNKFPSMVKPHKSLYLATLKSDVVAIGNRVKLYRNLDGPVRSVEIYSQKIKTWTHQYVRIDKNILNSNISFMCNLY